MNHAMLRPVLSLLALIILTGCHGPGRPIASAPADDRAAILGMAGTFKVVFNFEETLAVRDGHELNKPYQSAAEELVIVIDDTPGFIALQHLLVVRHEGEAHIIKHWRQDWRYEPSEMVLYAEGDVWDTIAVDPQFARGAWVQTVYNADDSPRYSSLGRWRHDPMVSSWTGSPAKRPLPLRENHLRDAYAYLYSINTHLVTAKGWVHAQDNRKTDPQHPTQTVLAIEAGLNQYTRIPDQGFDKAHDYWKNTAPFWQEVRAVWVGVLEENKLIRLRDRWKGDPMYSHLFGLADEYWGESDVADAGPRVEQIIRAFIVREDGQDQP